MEQKKTIADRWNALPGHIQVLLLAMGMSILMFLPFQIFDKGYFFFFGDFNVQQIPFYQLAHEAVRSGDIHWNWYTDLGVNFVGSYSFYLLFSPFFWLTLPFPTSFVPYLMAPLLVLKISLAAMTAYFYLKRFVQNPRYAIIGGILYAFSGYSIYNIFFNHFHEMILLFPLMLIALEELVVNNRRGWFALTVAINCVVNYWFFIGEVMFTIIYVFVRMTSPDWKMKVSKFVWIAVESVLGVGLALFALLPSIMAILGNPRTTSDNLLSGFSFWIYGYNQRLPAILQSIFFPPDLVSRPNFFPDQGAKWSSMTAWLPLFSTSGVIAYIAWARKSWLKKMLLICLVLACFPGTNSLFILFNNSYYARWFYMPILLMCLATIVALERREVDFMRGIKWTTGIIMAFTLAIALTPIRNGDQYEFGLMADPGRFWLTVFIALLCMALTVVLIRFVGRQDKRFLRLTTLALAVVSVLHGISFITNGKMHSDDPDFIRDVALYGRENLELDNSVFARSDIYSSMDNLGMYWHIPNIQAFHSVVPDSIMEFYPKVGVKRDVSSKPETKYYALRSLLSVRWFMIKESRDRGDEIMPGFVYHDNQLGYNIYENENFLPMGFGYDKAFMEDTLDQVPTDLRSFLMLQAVCLDIEDIVPNEDILEWITFPEYEYMDEYGIGITVQERRDMSCDSFEIDNRGFTATINLDRDTIQFFSVPWERGWSASVDGEGVEIYRANIGFMAIRVPAGAHTIRFDYTTPGLLYGAIATGGFLVLFAAYLLWARKFVKVGSVKHSRTEYNDEMDAGSPHGGRYDGSTSGSDRFLYDLLSAEEEPQLTGQTALGEVLPERAVSGEGEPGEPDDDSEQETAKGER